MKTFLFKHILKGVTISIETQELEGAIAILSKLVVNVTHWQNYR